MDKNLQLISLYEIYNSMLTKRMREIFELYYYSDLSLREIAENKDISYQAVNDCIKKVEKQLLTYEEDIKAMQMKNDILTLLENSDVNNKEIDKIARKYR